METCLHSPSAGSPVIVLGMHRSGTSYLASAVGALGAGLGDRLLGPAADNSRGYFEDEEFVALHVRILQRVIGPTLSNHPLGRIYLHEWTMPELSEEERAEANSLVRTRSELPFWGWKDPRTCLFLPLWLEILPRAALIAVYRHPLEVYGSIIRRKSLEIALDESIAVDSWLVYNRAILDAFARHEGPKVLVAAGELFQTPRRLCDLLAERLGLPAIAPSALPVFDAKDFRRWNLTAAAHAAFARVFPAAAAVFDRLEAMAMDPFRLPGGDDSRLAGLPEPAVMGRIERNLALPLLANALAPEFAVEHGRFHTDAAEYLAGRVEAADRFTKDVEAVLPKLWNRVQELERAQSDEKEAREKAALVEEVNNWRAGFLAAEALRRLPRPVFLWGVNSLSDAVEQRLRAQGASVAGVIDSRAANALRPSEFLARPPAAERPFVALCSRSARADMVQQLAEAGLRAGVDFVALPDQSHEYNELTR